MPDRVITINESVWELPCKQDAAFLRTLGYLTPESEWEFHT